MVVVDGDRLVADRVVAGFDGVLCFAQSIGYATAIRFTEARE